MSQWNYYMAKVVCFYNRWWLTSIKSDAQATLCGSCIKKGSVFFYPFWKVLTSTLVPSFPYFLDLFRSYLWIFMEIVLCFLEVVDFFYIHTKATCFIGSNREKCWAASRPLCPERNNPWIPCPNGAPPTSSADSVCSGGSQVFSSTTLEATHTSWEGPNRRLILPKLAEIAVNFCLLTQGLLIH